jgi:hypothetical protein
MAELQPSKLVVRVRFPSPALLVRARLRTGRLGPREMGSCGGEVITLIWTILGLLCIVLGFVGEIIDERILIGTLEWFVAAIAFNTLGGLPGVCTKRRG